MLDQVRQLTKGEVMEMRKRIRPMIVRNGILKVLDTTEADPIKTSYTWIEDMKFRESFWTKLFRKEKECIGKYWMKFPVGGYHGFFKPSEEEVLNRIPTDLLERVRYYWLNSENMDLRNIADGGKTQLCEILFYK